MTALVSAPARSRRLTIVLWGAQVLLALFFIVASSAPKLLGEQYAVQIFDQIDVGQWLRYFVGVAELAGGIGLLIPRLAGLASIGLAVLLVGATATQLFILHTATGAIFPAILFVVFVLLARARWAETKALTNPAGR